jgi:hypothetical protein
VVISTAYYDIITYLVTKWIDFTANFSNWLNFFLSRQVTAIEMRGIGENNWGKTSPKLEPNSGNRVDLRGNYPPASRVVS